MTGLFECNLFLSHTQTHEGQISISHSSPLMGLVGWMLQGDLILSWSLQGQICFASCFIYLKKMEANRRHFCSPHSYFMESIKNQNTTGHAFSGISIESDSVVEVHHVRARSNVRTVLVAWNVTGSRTDNLTEVKTFLETNTFEHLHRHKRKSLLITLKMSGN